MSKKTIVLPKEDEMLKRLVEVYDEPEAFKRFYNAYLLPNAGQEFDAERIASMLGWPLHRAGLQIEVGNPPIIPSWLKLRLRESVPELIDALVGDEALAKEAKESYKQLYGFG